MIATFFGDKDFPIEWDEGQKELFWVYDDLHIPNPVSPMYADIGGWWLSCDYMFRRFGTPFASDWLVKIINGYVYTAAIPAKPHVRAVGSEYGARYMGRTPLIQHIRRRSAPISTGPFPITPITFLIGGANGSVQKWSGNFLRFDSYDYDRASLLELAILLEEVIDIHDRHWKIHWLLNFSQFSATVALNQAIAEMMGEGDRRELMGRLQASTEDRNWDSIEGLWRMKEFIKGESGDIAKAFRKPTATDVFAALKESKAGRFFIADQLEPYLNVFGHKSMWAHEFSFKTWRENPVPAIEAIRGYLEMDYDFRTDLGRVGRDLEAAKAEVMEGIPASEDRDKLARALALSLKMNPLTPDHHFYIDQGTNARVRMVLIAIRKEAGGKGHAARRRGRYVSALQRTARGHGRELPRRCVGTRVGSPRRARGRLQTSSARLGGHRYRRGARFPLLSELGISGEILPQAAGPRWRHQRAARIRRRGRRNGEGAPYARGFRQSSEGRDRRLPNNKPGVGRPLHPHWRSCYRCWRDDLASRSRFPRVRRSGCGRHVGRDATDQDRGPGSGQWLDRAGGRSLDVRKDAQGEPRVAPPYLIHI